MSPTSSGPVIIYAPHNCHHPREERIAVAQGQDIFCCNGCGLTFTGTMWAAIDENGWVLV